MEAYIEHHINKYKAYVESCQKKVEVIKEEQKAHLNKNEEAQKLFLADGIRHVLMYPPPPDWVGELEYLENYISGRQLKIAFFESLHAMKAKMDSMEKELTEIRTMIEFAPGGTGYEEAEAEFNGIRNAGGIPKPV
jgi:hypothetical protein